MPNDIPLREPAPRVPSYRRHKPSGQAVVTLNGRDIYLGRYNTQASRAEYDRLIGEWLAAGRCLPKPDSDLTIAELVLRYWRFAKGYYVKDAYNRAICRAIQKANEKIVQEAAQAGVEPRLLPHWSPNQLRHSAAT